MTATSSGWRRTIGAAAVLLLSTAACTSDDDDAGDTGGDDTEAATATGTDGGIATVPTATEGTATDTAAATTTAATGEDSVVPAAQQGSRLEAVQSAGVLRCGTRDELPGFAQLDPSGEHVGFDADFCRVIAAAVLGDATAVEFVDLETADRFTALQSGEIDVLVRNTTWTATRDGAEGATFLHPTFYDGQGMMVAADSGFAALTDLDNVIVCVAQGTTTEGNAAAEAARLGLTWEVRAFEDTDLIQQAFEAGQCDAWSSDVSQLTGLRSAY